MIGCGRPSAITRAALSGWRMVRRWILEPLRPSSNAVRSSLAFPVWSLRPSCKARHSTPRCCARSGRHAADLGLYVFIHPLPRVIAWPQMYVDDLGRMLGWEFSLMAAAVRIINSGLLDELPTLKIQFSHFPGGIGRYLPPNHGLQARAKNGTP